MYNYLGKSNLKISRIGIGGNLFGAYVNEQQTHNILSKAAELGINFIDTADVYGKHKSEIIIGNFLKHHNRDSWMIATKLGLEPGETSDNTLTANIIIKRTENSLKRLQIDTIDLYQLHRFDEKTPVEETLLALNKLVKQGKVRYYGVCNFTDTQLIEIMNSDVDSSHLVSSQFGLNLFKRKYLHSVLPLCSHYDMGVLAYGVLARGILTNKYLNEETPSGSRAQLSNSIKSDVTPFIRNKLEAMHLFAKDRSQTVVGVALGWVLLRYPVCSAILGIRNIEQLQTNVESITTTLTENDMIEIDNIIGPLEEYNSYSLGVF